MRGVSMACYFITAKGDNKVLDVGNLVTYSIHSSHKIAHVYHPIINCHTPGFCWWSIPEYEVHCDDNLFYWDVLKKYRIHGDRGNDGDDLKYCNEIKKANLKYTKDVGLYL